VYVCLSVYLYACVCVYVCLQVMLVSLRAGGVGLNLIGGNHLFMLDMHWLVSRVFPRHCKDLLKVVVINNIITQNNEIMQCISYSNVLDSTMSSHVTLWKEEWLETYERQEKVRNVRRSL